MNEFIDKTYWIAVAHLPRWNTERTNRFIIRVIHEQKMPWADFFELGNKGWKELFDFSEKELADLEFIKSDMPRLAFIAEQLQSEGFQIIPINSPDYPAVLKDNLKTKSSPSVLYIKGRKGLLQEDAVAIVGARKAGTKALEFTDHVAKKSVRERKVVVSGFAKGVDKQALDSTIEAGGKSIIVLPQGILTFQSGFKKYYEPIANGAVLVLSTFFPKAGWEVGLAMARNAYIYGLAKEIYVAESDSKGGTWGGAMDGLKRNRKIYVRYPEAKEKNANLKIIELGGLPVNMDGEVIGANTKPATELFQPASKSEVHEALANYTNIEGNIENTILHFLTGGTYTSKEILLRLKLDWDGRKLTSFLKKNSKVKTIPGKPLKFTRNDVISPTLFG
ncbi:MAG: DNA-processing protein DprA [Chitinophagaceae bacterium]|nr:MAG: DNA-processing protein DprA [Chitinophagaceae bacterium]